MKNKLIFFLLCIITASTLFSCTSSLNTPPDNTNNEIETPSFTQEDMFTDIRSSKEKWLFFGLSAHEKNKGIVNLKDFFSDRTNMTYLTLYEHMFTYDKEKSVPVAEALFEFIYNNYGVEALLDIEKRCEYKTAYLKSLGLDYEYVQPKEIESHMASMNFQSSETYKYIISFDNVTYYFKDFSVGTLQQYHGLLYYSTTGLFKMIDYMKEHNFTEGLNLDRKYNFYMTLNGENSKTFYSTGDMFINSADSTLHEALHAMGIQKQNNIWLSEGICNYLGKSLGFNDSVNNSYIQILKAIKAGYYNELANSGNTDAILKKMIYDEYISLGGKLDSINSFNYRLLMDVSSRIELDSQKYMTLGEVYENSNQKECVSVGKELSYDQATSMILYLADTYGINKVFQAYTTQDVNVVFGKDFEALKAEWLVYLNN